MSSLQLPDGVEVTGKVDDEGAKILTPEALELVAQLHRKFDARRRELLQARVDRQTALDAGEKPDFLPETAEIRAGDWKIAPQPEDMLNRRAEITGPVDRKMIINALNSGADSYMTDFEDSNTPTWKNIIQGQVNLRDAVNRTIRLEQGEKVYELGDTLATLIVRPRGWHLEEKHILVDGEVVSGGIFDMAVYFLTNHEQAKKNGSGPYFYLPKMEHHLEARLWNDIFVHCQEYAGVPIGTIKATVLIETIMAAFQMDEILYELRDHSTGLNAGRWDYIFSCIKRFGRDPEMVLADRKLVTMTTHFMTSYATLLVKTCHKRGAHGMGGMAAQIPIKNDEEANAKAFELVKADKVREANLGHDGTWVAHPGLVPVALEAFEAVLGDKPNQLGKQLDDEVTQADLLDFGPTSPITEEGLRMNVSVGIQYLGYWLAGMGAVPINNLMEDAATAEISRSQVWQWIRSPNGVLADGRKVTAEMFDQVLNEELAKITEPADDYATEKFNQAAKLFRDITVSDEFTEFLTLPAYEHLG